jgi:lipopolysaccharide export system permease protein
MEKLIYQKLLRDILKRKLIIIFSLGLIVWVIQATNYLDFVINDGHNFKIYFYYSLLSLPKIFSRILPFALFIAIFFELLKYEKNNEILIYWVNGINKQKLANKILFLALLITLFQIFLTSFLSPFSQAKARGLLKLSKIDFLPTLLKEGKFIDNISNLTIYIEKKLNNTDLENIYIQEGGFLNLENDDNTNNRIIFAERGYLTDDNNKRFLNLVNGKILSKNNDKLVSLDFEKINYDLSTLQSKSITNLKIQEIGSLKLLNCVYSIYKGFSYKDNSFNCEKDKLKDFNKELYKRFIQPFFILSIVTYCCFLIIFNRIEKKYNYKIIKLFFQIFLIIIISEFTLRYINTSINLLYFLLLLPFVFFIISKLRLKKKIYNV